MIQSIIIVCNQFFRDNGWATTVDEAKQILTAGYEYITEKKGIILFRRPKRFNASNTIT